MTSPWYSTLGVFDLETTGIDVETSRIVSAHVGVIDADGEPLEQFTWLADPGVEIPVESTAVHGISTEQARAHGRPSAEVIPEILREIRLILARGIPLTVYNAPYDLTLLDREAKRYGVAPIEGPMPVIDPLVLDKAVDKWRKGKRTLEATARLYDVILDEAHDAAADALAAGRVAQAIGRQYEDVLEGEAMALHRLQVQWCAEQASSFQEYMRRTKDPGFTTSGLWPQR